MVESQCGRPGVRSIREHGVVSAVWTQNWFFAMCWVDDPILQMWLREIKTRCQFRGFTTTQVQCQDNGGADINARDRCPCKEYVHRHRKWWCPRCNAVKVNVARSTVPFGITCSSQSQAWMTFATKSTKMSAGVGSDMKVR